MAMTIRVDIVSLEKQIFSGAVELLTATGMMGELSIMLGHAPLLTELKPGFVKVLLPSGEKEFFYVSGGMLEVQPRCITVLADAAEHARDLDEKAVLEAKEQAEAMLKTQGKEDYSKIAAELARASAQLQLIQNLRKPK